MFQIKDRRFFLLRSSHLLALGMLPNVSTKLLGLLAEGRTRFFSTVSKAERTRVEYILRASNQESLEQYTKERNLSVFNRVCDEFRSDGRIVDIFTEKQSCQHLTRITFRDQNAFQSFFGSVVDQSAHNNTEVRKRLNIDLDVYFS